MAAKRKISVRKVLQLLLTVVVGTCCVMAIVSASRIEGTQTLKALPVVHISNDRKYHFIEQQHIMDLAIYDRNIDVLHTPVSKLDLRGIEKAITADPWVADAQVYIGIDRLMHIFVTQRVPIARLFRANGMSYYMDSTLHTMPLSESYTYYTMVVANVPDIENDSARLVMKRKIATMVNTIRTDSFWNAQVSHVVVDSVGEFELIPVLGEQKIKFGDTSRAKEKLGNLMAFYRNVLNRIGWDKYEVLDVRFKGQVVASPSLPYKVDDAAFARMSWVASVKAAQEQNRTTDSAHIAARMAAQSAAEKLTLAASMQQAEAKKNRKGSKDAGKEKKEKLKGKEALDKVHKSLGRQPDNGKHAKAKEKEREKEKETDKDRKVASAHKKADEKPAADKPKAISKAPVAAHKKDAPAAAARAKAGKTREPEKAKGRDDKKKKEKEKQNDKNSSKKKEGGKYTYPGNKGH